MSRDEQKPLDTENDDWGLSSGGELGALLRKEREKRGLSHAQISELTRLRPRILEALENEEWDLLPSPAYVKGFIRSYGRVLGLEEEVIESYEELIALHEVPLQPVYPSGSNKRRLPLYIFVIVILLALVTGYYAWVGYSTRKDATADLNTAGPSSNDVIESKGINDIRKGGAVRPFRGGEEAAVVFETEKVLTKEEAASAPKDYSLNSVDQQPAGQGPSPEEPKLFHETEATSDIETVAHDPPPATEANRLEFVLKAIINERTWIRIFVDNQRPAEYVFRPESRPEWRAKTGFELLIGNAGGINLEFNGKKIENLGKQGQVIRLSLPEGYERKILED